jgi:hypothetical protein
VPGIDFVSREPDERRKAAANLAAAFFWSDVFYKAVAA